MKSLLDATSVRTSDEFYRWMGQFYAMDKLTYIIPNEVYSDASDDYKKRISQAISNGASIYVQADIDRMKQEERDNLKYRQALSQKDEMIPDEDNPGGGKTFTQEQIDKIKLGLKTLQEELDIVREERTQYKNLAYLKITEIEELNEVVKEQQLTIENLMKQMGGMNEENESNEANKNSR